MPAPFEDRLAGRDVGAAHPAGQDRLARALGVAASSRSAVCVGSVMAWGVRMTSRPSLFGSRAGDLQRLRVAVGVGVAQDVDRVAVAPVGGQERRSAPSSVSARQLGELAAAGDQARRWPARRGRRRWSGSSGAGPSGAAACRAPRPCRRARRCSSTRSTPQRRKAASSTSSLPVREPVCEAAACAAASVRPALMTMIGLVSATSRAAERNDAGVADRLHVDDDALRAAGRRRGSRSGRPSRRRASSRRETKALRSRRSP